MRTAAVAVLLLVAAGVCRTAEPDEDVVRSVARHTRLPPGEIRKHHDACDSGVTLQMNICTTYRWAAQQLRMERAYQRLLATARRGNVHGGLAQAEKQWSAYLDRQCRAEGALTAEGGTLQGLQVVACKEQLTRQRAERLEGLADAQERR